jgi:hypothetical protein
MTNPFHRTSLKLAVMLLLLLGLPPLGIWLVGKPVEQYLEFPPLTRYVQHAGFSWMGFVFLAAVNVAMLAPLVVALWRTRRPPRANTLRLIRLRGASADDPPKPRATAGHAFPWWGWLGLSITALDWVLAWSRFGWFEALQPFTFSPLWIGYILIINALTYRRTGHCMLSDRPRYFLLLFPASAALWWFFEYLNRFVQNWYYVGIDDLGPVTYVLYATPPFATVLPAVLGTKEFLESFPWLDHALQGWRSVWVRHPRLVGWAMLLLAAVGLTGIGIWPDSLYPLLWVSPLLVITSLQAISGERTVFSSVTRGDWRRIYCSAIAALICGFFWEMWNFHSAAKWVYTVPYVYRYLVFEMPLLGFGGYLPFGLECAVIGMLIPDPDKKK